MPEPYYRDERATFVNWPVMGLFERQRPRRLFRRRANRDLRIEHSGDCAPNCPCVAAEVSRSLEDAGEADPAMCACGHGLHLHDPEVAPCLCVVCGDNTRCDYADPETIAADRWDEGYIAAVGHLTPPALSGAERVVWALQHMPKENPYRPEALGAGEVSCDCPRATTHGAHYPSDHALGGTP